MSVEELLREAQYEFHSVSYGDTRANRKHRARATALAKKIIRKSPTSSEASQANDLLIRLSGRDFGSQLEAKHRHQSSEPKHSHADLLRRGDAQFSQNSPFAGAALGLDGETVTPSAFLSAMMGLKSNYLMTGLGLLIFFLLIFGFFIPLLAIAALVFFGPARKKAQPDKKVQANRAMQVVYQWMLSNQR